MHFSVDNTAFNRVIERVGRAAPARSTMPILNHALITADDRGISVRATDLELTLVAQVAAQVFEPGAVAVPLRMLSDITGALPASSLTLTCGNDWRVTLAAPEGSYELTGLPPADFPSLPEVDNKKEVSVRASALLWLVQKTNFALAKEELKPALMGALFEFGDKELRAVATDGHRLVVCSRKDEQAKAFQGSVILPRKFLSVLSQQLSGLDQDVTLWVGDSHVTIILEDQTIFSRLIDERYPDYRAVMPAENDKVLSVERDGLVASIRRASIFSNKNSRQISLNLSAQECSIRAEDPETSARAAEILKGAVYSGDDLSAAFNALYLGDMVSHADGARVQMSFKTPMSAAVITPEIQQENGELTMLLMPMRGGNY